MEKPVFDYIICGGGAAGLLLLNALSKDPFFLKKDIFNEKPLVLLNFNIKIDI